MERTGDNIRISVQTEFLREHSDPAQNRYTFGYTITIENQSRQCVKLLTRHWIITDADAKVQEVHGEGVIGVQPLIMPDKRFTYSSGAMINTPVGSMQGSYTMLGEDGATFEVPIPPFHLGIPELVN